MFSPRLALLVLVALAVSSVTACKSAPSATPEINVDAGKVEEKVDEAITDAPEQIEDGVTTEGYDKSDNADESSDNDGGVTTENPGEDEESDKEADADEDKSKNRDQDQVSDGVKCARPWFKCLGYRYRIP